MKAKSVLTATVLRPEGTPVRPAFGWRRPVARWLLGAALAAVVAAALGYEIRTSGLEARLVKAGLLYLGNKLGLPVSVQGGSTLAIQLEKYRLSPGGRTNSVGDKLRQVASATLKAYRDGADTRLSRRDIVLDYFNTAPLAGVPGYGEINGLGEGLHVWFGLELPEVKKDLADGAATPQKARTYKHALALLVALHAPTTYLTRSRDALEEKAD
jgi:membrane peptidoglycan carboxypeptidase